MEVIVNRIEGNYLVLELENGHIIEVDKELIPNAKENDIIDIIINKDKTNRRLEEVQKLVDDVFED